MILENLNATTSIAQYREVTEPEIDPPQTENSSDDSPEVADDKGSRGHDTRQTGDEHHGKSSTEGEEDTHRVPLPDWKGQNVDIVG